MSPVLLLTLTALLLLSPWLLMPPRRTPTEIRGVARLLWGINAFLCATWHRLEVKGPVTVPAEGPAILIANHTSGLDPMLLQASCRRRLGFLIAQEWYNYRPIHWICRQGGCIPVRRDGNDLAATRAALRVLEEGRVVPIFPEGRIIPCSGAAFGEPRPGVAFLVLHARVPVIPAYIHGTPPTNQIWRGILTPSHSRVVFGAPIDLSDVLSDGPIDRELLPLVAERLMAAVRALRLSTTEETRTNPPSLGAPRDARSPASGPHALPGDRPAALPA